MGGRGSRRSRSFATASLGSPELVVLLAVLAIATVETTLNTANVKSANFIVWFLNKATGSPEFSPGSPRNSCKLGMIWQEHIPRLLKRSRRLMEYRFDNRVRRGCQAPPDLLGHRLFREGPPVNLSVDRF